MNKQIALSIAAMIIALVIDAPLLSIALCLAASAVLLAEGVKEFKKARKLNDKS